MLADVHVEGSAAADEVSIFWHEKGVLVFFPITRDRFRVIADLGHGRRWPTAAPIRRSPTCRPRSTSAAPAG